MVLTEPGENPMFARTLKQFGKKGVLNQVMETIEQIAMEVGVDEDIDETLEPPLDDDGNLVNVTTSDYNQPLPGESTLGHSMADASGSAYAADYGSGITGRDDWEEMARGQLSGRYVPVTPHPGTGLSNQKKSPAMYDPRMPGGLGQIAEEE